MLLHPLLRVYYISQSWKKTAKGNLVFKSCACMYKIFIFENYINMSSRFESLFRHSCRKWCSLRRNFYRFRDFNVLFSSLLQEKNRLYNDTNIRNFSCYSGISTQWLLWDEEKKREYRVSNGESGDSLDSSARVPPYYLDFLSWVFHDQGNTHRHKGSSSTRFHANTRT